MTDELPGFVSDLTAHESAVDTAIADGWETRGYSITFIPAAGTVAADTLVMALLWKAGAQENAVNAAHYQAGCKLKQVYREKMRGR